MTTLKRIVQSGWKNFKRAANLSLATCLILVLASSLVGGLFLSKEIIGFLVDEAKKKADVSVYLKKDCELEEAFRLKDGLSSLPEVKAVEMKTEEEALSEFVDRHGEEESLMASLSEVGYNPFLASLSVKAAEVEHFETITYFLEGEEYEEMIEKIDYHKRKPVIEKIFDLSRLVNRVELVTAGIFVIASIVITFTTIRLAIEARKQEISIMRLVGASDSFIQGPYIVQALIWATIAFFVSFVVLGLVSYALTPRIGVFFPGFRIFSFFRESWYKLALVQLGASFFLALVPTFFAVRRYLKV